ncbi:MAG: alpha/beta fold hydrolase [Planctomycetota bacterium]
MSKSEPIELDDGPSRLSVALGRLTLSAGRYPGRKYIGAVHRKVSRERGGQRFTVHRPNDVKLDAWFSPRREGTRTRLPIVIAHGLMETKERHFKTAWKMNARGHDVVLFDHRVHGRSTGRRLTFGVEEKRDISAVIDAAASRGLIKPSADASEDLKVITMGFSLGGGTVLQHAAIDERVAGVVALAPFADFRGAIESFRRTLVPWMDREWIESGFDAASAEAGFKMDEASAIEALKQIDVPILLAEGGKDPYLPGIDHVHKLADSAAGKNVTIVRIDEANHNTLVHKNWPKLDRAIARFCRDVSAQN